MINDFRYQKASMVELELKWDKNIADNIGDDRWVAWKSVATENHKNGKCSTFVVLCGKEPVGEGTLVYFPQSVEINGLRIDKKYEGKGHISKLVKIMEQYAKNEGYKTSMIGVEPKETRNLAIYLHWGYDTFVKLEIFDGRKEEGLVLHYSKEL